MSKNPFEIRLETLKMAKEMMDQQLNLQEQFAHQVLNQYIEAGKDVTEFWQEIPCRAPDESLPHLAVIPPSGNKYICNKLVK